MSPQAVGAQQELADATQSPELAMTAMGQRNDGAGAPPSAPGLQQSPPVADNAMSDQDALKLMQGGQVTPQPQDSAMTDQQALALMSGGADGGASAPGQAVPAAPTAAPSSSILTQLMTAGTAPTAALLDATAGPKDAPAKAQMWSEFAKHPQGRQQIFQNLAGAGFESRVAGKEVEFRKAGEPDSAWRPVKPGWFDSVHSFMQRTADMLPEAFEGGVMALSTVTGAAEGAAAGAAAGSVVPGAGTAAGGVLGAVGGMAVAGAASAGAAAVAREGMARLLGSDPDPNLSANIMLQSAIGGVAPVVGAAFRRPAQAAADWLVSKASSGQEALAVKVGDFMEKFADIYSDVTGRPATQGTASTYAAGQIAQNAIGSATKQLEDNVATVWSAAQSAMPQARFPLPNLVKSVEDTLTDAGYQFVPKPRVTLAEPLVHEVRAPSGFASKFLGGDPEIQQLHRTLADAWEEQANNGGVSIEGMRSLQKTLGDLAGYGAESPSAAQRSYRELYSALRLDRNSVLSQAVKGTEAEGIAEKAFSSYADKIDDLRLLSRGAEKSPEGFAKWLFRDADTAKLAKDVMFNPESEALEGLNGWDAVKGAWFRDHMEQSLDAKTGIVDMTKLFARVSKNPELAKTVMGEGKLEQLRGLSTAMSRISWEQLVAKPDSAQSGAILRALAKFGISGGHPAYGAAALGAMTSYDKNVLSGINQLGIQAFAREATTLQEKNYWLRASKMITRMLDATTIDAPGLVGGKVSVPVEASILPVLLNAGVRPVVEPLPQQQAVTQRAYQMFQESQQERQARMDTEVARAQAQVGASGPPHLALKGPGSDMRFGALSPFAKSHGGVRK